jgi:hypothetical protein
MTQSARDDSARTPVATTVTAAAPVHPGADAARRGETLPAQHRDVAPHKAQPSGGLPDTSGGLLPGLPGSSDPQSDPQSDLSAPTT